MLSSAMITLCCHTITYVFPFKRPALFITFHCCFILILHKWPLLFSYVRPSSIWPPSTPFSPLPTVPTHPHTAPPLFHTSLTNTTLLLTYGGPQQNHTSAPLYTQLCPCATRLPVVCQSSVVSRQSSVISHQSSVFIRRRQFPLSVANSQLPIVRCQSSSSVVISQSSVVSYQLLVISCQLSVASCQLSVVSWQSSVIISQFPVFSYQLLVSSCQLPVASCQLSVVTLLEWMLY
jgi:hypothetical protein